MCSVYTAELYAIKTALEALGDDDGSFVICTDSLSALQSISVFSPVHPIVQEIHSLLLTLTRKGIDICFLWVPGHKGIAGNEKADAMAKEALSDEELASTLVPYEDLRASLRNAVVEQWRESWRTLNNNKLRGIKGEIAAWPSSSRSNRREEVVLTRLRIGHCPLTHAYLFTEEKEPPQCDDCRCPLSIRHILIDCDKYSDARRRINLRRDLESLLGDHPTNVNYTLQFLKEISIFNKI
jgi:hypothetical protein